MYLGNPGVKSADGSIILGASYSQMQLVKMHSTSYQNFLIMPVGLPRPLLLNTRKQLPFEIFAARRRRSTLRKEEDFKGASPVRPPSLFVKQSPIPTRRPLRCAPFTNLLSQSVNEPEQGKRLSGLKTSKEVVPKALSDKDSVENNLPKKEEQVHLKEKADRVSKWASLFEAASTSTTETPATSTETKDADAWFDKIFPKNVNQPKEGEISAPPKLSAQQEKSIQQLQTLVKTLGVATRNPAPPTRRNKPTKIRQLPLQGGVDPVPFSSILKKLQSVSVASQQAERSKLEGVVESPVASESQVLEKRGSSKPATREEEEAEDEDDNDVEEDEESSEEDDSEEEDEEEEEVEETRGAQAEQSGQVTSDEEDEEDDEVEETPVAQAVKSGHVTSEPTGLGVNELSKSTVVALRSMAKAKGLSGYSRLKKDDLVQLLAKTGN